MSMDSAAGYADTVNESFVALVAEKELAELMKWFEFDVKDIGEKPELDFDDFARDAMYGELSYGDDRDETVVKAYHKLQKAFKKATGLSLNLNYHDGENCGSSYDDVDGIYWSVDGVYVLSPAGKKYNKYINRSFFTMFG